MVKNGCGLSGHRTLKLTVSEECTHRWSKHFLNAGANSGKLKVASMSFGWARSKIGKISFDQKLLKMSKIAKNEIFQLV